MYTISNMHSLPENTVQLPTQYSVTGHRGTYIVPNGIFCQQTLKGFKGPQIQTKQKQTINICLTLNNKNQKEISRVRLLSKVTMAAKLCRTHDTEWGFEGKLSYQVICSDSHKLPNYLYWESSPESKNIFGNYRYSSLEHKIPLSVLLNFSCTTSSKFQIAK